MKRALASLLIAVMGGAQVDLCDAELEPDTDLVATAVFGGVEVLVPEGVHVDLGGFAFLGSKDYRVRDGSRRTLPGVSAWTQRPISRSAYRSSPSKPRVPPPRDADA